MASVDTRVLLATQQSGTASSGLKRKRSKAERGRAGSSPSPSSQRKLKVRSQNMCLRAPVVCLWQAPYVQAYRACSSQRASKNLLRSPLIASRSSSNLAVTAFSKPQYKHLSAL